jgi:hypothetical protein
MAKQGEEAMKKILFTIFTIAFYLTTLNAQIQNQRSREIIYDNIGDFNGQDFPEYNIVDDLVIGENYYDYMPGGYSSLPIRINDDGRVFIAFHVKATNEVADPRRASFAQIEDGYLVLEGEITAGEGYQGYVGIDLDPVTSDPFYVWHERMDEDEILKCYLAWEAFSIYPTLIHDPFVVIDNEEIAGVHTPFDDDQFIWPDVFISNCPTDENKRRIHVIANNYISHNSNNESSQSSLIAYADFTTEDLNDIEINIIENLEWNYETIPIFDAWNAANPGEWIRPYKTAIVSDEGRVGFVGHINKDDLSFDDENLFYIRTEDVANPNWEESWAVGHQSVEMLYDEDGTPLPISEPGFNIVNTKHFNAIIDENEKIRFIGNVAVRGIFDDDVNGNYIYFPNHQYVKEYVIDANSGEFEIVDLHPQGVDIHDGNPALPWNLSESDIWVPMEDIVIPENFPSQYWETSEFYRLNKFNITQNKENGWLVAIWMDATKSRKFNEFEENLFIFYAEVPEIFICASADNGENWTKPLVLNSLNTPEFSDEVPAFIYPGDKIEEIEDGWGKLHLFYLDDNVYGSDNHPYWYGGTQKYKSIDINFGELNQFNPVDDVVASNSEFFGNYPNPFNIAGKTRSGSTTFKFAVENDNTPVDIVIYNVKGQKIKTICEQRFNHGEHEINWNGCNENNKKVSSGIYLTRVKLGGKTFAHKVMVIK